MRADTELVVIVTDANGTTKTLSGDAPDPGDRPQGLQFGTQIGSGFYTASFNLTRAIDRDNEDLHLGDDVKFIGANGETAYEGYITALPRSMDTDGHNLGVTCAGWIASAADNPFSMIFVDRDLSHWSGAAIERNVNLLAAAFTQAAAPSVINDTGRAALVLQHADKWASPIHPIAEAWYDAGPGNTIGTIYYDIVNVGSADPLNALYDLYVRTSATDDFAAVNASSGDLWPAPDAGYLVDGDPVRYAVISFYYNGTPGGADGYVYSVQCRDLAVYGNVDLLLRTTGDPYGVAASEALKWAVANHAPLLNTDEVLDTTYPIEHLVAEDMTVTDLILKVNSFHNWPFGVWENRTLRFAPVDLNDYDWEIRHDEMGSTIGLQGDELTALRNRLRVKFTNVATGRQELLTGSDYSELRDDSIDNPLNTHGRERSGEPFVIPYPTTIANALELGRIRLLEDNQPKAPGSFTRESHVRDRSGQLQPAWKVRAGDRVRLISSANLSDRPRLVQETSYSHDSKTVTIGVDSTFRVLDAYMDRVTTALTAAGLQ